MLVHVYSCGGDADLILLGAAALKDVGNVFIMPEMSSKASKNCPIINPFQILATYPNVSAADFTAASTLVRISVVLTIL